MGRGLALSLLRGFEITEDGKPVAIAWGAQRLVAFLALKARPLTRTYVACVLWPESTTEKAKANLRTSLWRIQRACRQLIITSSQQVALAPVVAVDLRSARVNAQRLLDRRNACEDLLHSGTRDELAADLLPDWYDDDWVLVERDHHHQLRLHALEALCERLTVAGRHGEAVVAGLAAIQAEPLRESAHRVVIHAHLAADNRWEAIRQYERYRLLLQEELGLEPASAIRDLLSSVQPRPALTA
ncbi:AfsR/SARP family transcriptional regulator [Nonomuraea jiangxiensis]|uniref:DNA-binding transcriptional activator of the SARP family n=1 Tax=Nonomuraea jiangxiensis TaxID=633440 RepID=A0A1G8JP64_9ACTN|nr:BTAD domain-containing putative transcriptional regulator [Nonomuraea jiangxiensis]SDI32873.1 DNA-binding transcriptional activator of the SARP family [Nonomuraea jiangxiensis]